MTSSCEDDLEVFRQHSGECWNDSIQNFFMFGSGIGNQVREILSRASATESFRTWISSPKTEAWLKKEFAAFKDPTLLPVFQSLAIAYIQCFKERIDNWEVQRKAKLKVMSRRRASCVFSQCSAAAGMYASELLWTPEEGAAIGRPPNLITPEILEGLRSGAIDPAKNAQMNREADRVQKGYTIWSAYRFLRVLIYYFTKKDRYIPLEQLSSVPVETLAKKAFLICDFSIDFPTFSSIYQVMKRSHSINIFAAGFNILKGVNYPIGHQLQLLACDTHTRDEYIYDDNAHVLQKVKWAKMFEPGSKSFYLRWHDDKQLDARVVERIFLMLFSAQAFVSGGARTTEKMRENYHKLAKQEEDPLLKTPMTYLANFLDSNDLTTREEDKKSFFDVISIDIKQKAAKIREDLLEFIKAHYADSQIIKIFASFKPVLIVCQESKYYFFNKTGFLVLTDEQLQEDGLTIAGLLFCEDSMEKYLHFLATAFHTCKAFYDIRQAELMWLTPRHTPLLPVVPVTNKSLKKRSLGNFMKKRSLKQQKRTL